MSGKYTRRRLRTLHKEQIEKYGNSEEKVSKNASVNGVNIPTAEIHKNIPC